MAAITRDAPNRYRIHFRELGTSGIKRLFGGGLLQVDPFLIARGLGQVMRQASMRSAAGRVLLWNEYRVILSRADFEPLRGLQREAQVDLAQFLTEEAKRLRAELKGDLCVHLVADEGADLTAGEAVVRVEFAETARLAAPSPGEMTIRVDCAIISGEVELPMRNPARQAHDPQTVHVADPLLQSAAYHLQWPGGTARLPAGIRIVLGREHSSPPPHFIALTGAGERVNKQQLWLLASAASVTVGRFSAANPVAVDGTLVRASEQVEISHPRFQIDLSRGVLLLTLARASE